ncbi:DHA2 family multidrug resistance protein-like MFS transporter [Streptomyces olivoverticillatus]|uniref:DHA2 family multidrug resistance protein-like MFS transporter n=1 Tax=Streptomyces olivoverticillatus TaxID=66427 RepID=A0A7W7LJ20_9ACTN|nr:MFS transporter [Streptomyces olivoverticillatus]MBB4891135.1 DHA2 family multidrug resistance protein-like MFS transporter [Streptomyces olivoverticillatus]
MHPHDETASGPRAGRKEWTALAVLMLPLLLVSMDVSVLYFAVPFIARDLQPSGTQQLWIFDIYGFVLSGMLLTMGALGDRIGRRKLLLIGATAFGAASVAAAYAQSPTMLIVCRAVLGIGGATLMPSTLALVRNMFRDAKQRATAVAIWSAAMASGISLGPVLSGFLLNHFWWGSVFLVNLPAMLLLLILGPLLVPEFKSPPTGRRFDLLSSLLSFAAVLPVVYGLKEMAADGFAAGPALSIAAGLAVGALFVRRQRTAEEPMISPELFRGRGFGPAVGVNAVAMFAMAGFTVFSTQYMQLVLGKSPLEAALWCLIPSVAVGGAAPAATALVRKGVDRAYVIGGGFAVAAVGYLAALAAGATSGIWVILVSAGIVAVGIVTVMSLITDLALDTAPPHRSSSAAALLETGQEFGAALGTAVLGSLGTAFYRHDVTDAVPATLPPETFRTVHETLGNALAAAGHLPSPMASAVATAARGAFTTGMHAAAVGAAVAVTAGAVLAPMLLRGVRPAAAETAPEAASEAVTAA